MESTQSNFIFNNEAHIELELKIENICTHLANELIEFGLINSKDHNLISDLLFKTIKTWSLMSNEL